MNELEYLITQMNTYATNKTWGFAHGFVSQVNQKENEGDSDIFLQVFDVKTQPKVLEIGVEFNTFQVDLFLGMPSVLGNAFYKQDSGVVVDSSNYAFNKTFVPLFDEVKTFINYLSVCDRVSFENISPIIQRVNYQDHNLDGYSIGATIKVF
tara:strand:- start:3416 stop:3871 length:456 start_codon:yes stop_codon:yes gene_type:complete